jgi:hypothetical protein
LRVALPQRQQIGNASPVNPEPVLRRSYAVPTPFLRRSYAVPTKHTLGWLHARANPTVHARSISVKTPNRGLAEPTSRA